MIPPRLQSSIEQRLRDQVADVRILDAARVSGGCISPAVRLDTTAGRYFLKWREAGLPDGLFAAEATSLAALARSAAVRVPRVVACDPDWLLLEWLEPGAAGTLTMARLGTSLAAMHRVSAPKPGWVEDNFIGPLPQSNAMSEDWPAFWADRRLHPQWERAVDAGFFVGSDRRCFDRFVKRLDVLLDAGRQEIPSLLHGDLWTGNVHVMANGEAALIDPSCYYGHREVDLAMAELFGGFGRAFHEAYRRAWPLLPGYEERRDAYQLYYLLVHVNLFGSSYVSGSRSIVRKYGS